MRIAKLNHVLSILRKIGLAKTRLSSDKLLRNEKLWPRNGSTSSPRHERHWAQVQYGAYTVIRTNGIFLCAIIKNSHLLYNLPLWTSVCFNTKNCNHKNEIRYQQQIRINVASHPLRHPSDTMRNSRNSKRIASIANVLWLRAPDSWPGLRFLVPTNQWWISTKNPWTRC